MQAFSFELSEKSARDGMRGVDSTSEGVGVPWDRVSSDDSGRDFGVRVEYGALDEFEGGVASVGCHHVLEVCGCVIAVEVDYVSIPLRQGRWMAAVEHRLRRPAAASDRRPRWGSEGIAALRLAVPVRPIRPVPIHDVER